jgi:rubrerythrin
MSREALINMLLAMRSQIDAALCILGQEPEEEEEAGECRHPLESRKNYSTMGATRWMCGICGYLHEEVNQAGSTGMEEC